MSVNTPYNLMRPETAESLFYLWRFTGNKVYQDMGWNIFQAFENSSRLETGYVGLQDVSPRETSNILLVALFYLLILHIKVDVLEHFKRVK